MKRHRIRFRNSNLIDGVGGRCAGFPVDDVRSGHTIVDLLTAEG